MNKPQKKINTKILLDLFESSEDKEKLEFLEKFLTIFQTLHKSKLEKFDRSLPLGEYFIDRWERAELLGFGEGSSIYDSAIVIGRVDVGFSTWIGPNVLLDGSGGLDIGSNCSISSNVQIYSHDSVLWATSGGVEEYQYESTKIGNNCYIGPNSVIEKGVTIADQAIIGANSFVNQDVESGAKYAGNPAKKIIKK